MTQILDDSSDTSIPTKNCMAVSSFANRTDKCPLKCPPSRCCEPDQRISIASGVAHTFCTAETKLRGWAYRTRTAESARELSNWNCVATSPEVSASRAAETRHDRPRHHRHGLEWAALLRPARSRRRLQAQAKISRYCRRGPASARIASD
jgi:hypothetical protein